MKINILISTIDEGIGQVPNVLLESRPDVSYIISHQYTDRRYKVIPDYLNRTDITLLHIPVSGITKSRNNAIRLSDGDIGLFADDDAMYRPSDIDVLKKTFIEHNYTDVAIFKIRTPRENQNTKISHAKGMNIKVVA